MFSYDFMTNSVSACQGMNHPKKTECVKHGPKKMVRFLPSVHYIACSRGYQHLPSHRTHAPTIGMLI